MRRYLIGIMLIALMTVAAKCSGKRVPNVYQAPTAAEVMCPEIEYRWEGEAGLQTGFYPGKGDFCVRTERPPDTPLLARCVHRGDDGTIVWAGDWIESTPAGSIEEFVNLCRNAESISR